MCTKIAIITGSRRGIGLSIAKNLGLNGYKIIISDVVSYDEVLPLLAELLSQNIACDYIKCDISNFDDRTHLVETVVGKYHRIDILVNNAGVAPTVRADILETSIESFDRLMNINLKGTFFMTQVVSNQMIELQKQSLEDYTPRIVNISSMSAYTSSTARGEYCISKAGISMVTMLFADRLAEYGIPVFEVRPGIIMTDMTVTVSEKYEKLIADGITPIKRFGQPQDVANCVLSACSGLLDFATGQVLNADGGFHIRRL
ncbi:MAG: 3-ketoacyl-ACP reductase [Oscillospiraceae bacterium]